MESTWSVKDILWKIIFFYFPLKLKTTLKRYRNIFVKEVNFTIKINLIMVFGEVLLRAKQKYRSDEIPTVTSIKSNLLIAQ